MAAKVVKAAGAVLALAFLSGCSFFQSFGATDPDAVKRAEDPYHTDPKYADPDAYNVRTQQGTDSRNLFGLIFGGSNTNNNGGGGGPGGVGVNSFLWRATLDTVSFMPLASADPFGGVIITDWYSPQQTPDERFKLNIFILGRDLRADGVRASVFRQKRDPNGQWVDAPVDQTTGTNLENAILTRARQMRLSTASR